MFRTRLRLKTLYYTSWYRPGGGMMYNRECLEPWHPEHPYNWFKKHFPYDKPEWFGFSDPMAGREKEILSSLRENELFV